MTALRAIDGGGHRVARRRILPLLLVGDATLPEILRRRDAFKAGMAVLADQHGPESCPGDYGPDEGYDFTD